MSTKEIIYICQSCNRNYNQWLGKCICGKWNTIEKKSLVNIITKNQVTNKNIIFEKIIKLNFDILELKRICEIKTKSIYVIGGEPGIGKSTFVAQLLLNIKDVSKLYLSGEEAKENIQSRFERVLNLTKKYFNHASMDNINIIEFTILEDIYDLIEKYNPKIIIVDSIHTTESKNNLNITKICSELSDIAKKYNIAVILVSHITKNGIIAGPKTIEHIVDVVLYIEGHRSDNERYIKSVKNRLGPTSEIGLLTMTEEGLKPSNIVPNIDINKKKVGSIIYALEVGKRILFTEIQSLVVQENIPRVESDGIKINRIRILIGVLKKIFNLKINFHTIIINILHGLSTNNNITDLSICAVILSSFYNKPISQQYIFFGEVSLTGEILPYQNLSNTINLINKYMPNTKLIACANANIKNIYQIKNIKELLNFFS